MEPVNTNVYGGFIEFAVTKGTVNGNEIYIYGDTDLSTGGVIGGQVAMESPTITGNTLIFGYNNTAWTPSSYTIDKVRNFSTIRFANAT
ncbi:MAG: hypothetical protein J6M93_05400 [Succinivibrio sp.]|nr:hypothetical protein [Succinivibrio sp.]